MAVWCFYGSQGSVLNTAHSTGIRSKVVHSTPSRTLRTFSTFQSNARLYCLM